MISKKINLESIKVHVHLTYSFRFNTIELKYKLFLDINVFSIQINLSDVNILNFIK